MTEQRNDVSTTPALIYDEKILSRDINAARTIADNAGAQLLFSMKACYVRPILERLTPVIDGFSTSSLFEARFAGELRRDDHIVHLTSPAFSREEAAAMKNFVTHVSFNSIAQWKVHQDSFLPTLSRGLRINPQSSHVADKRYDPCRPHSHLGVTVAELIDEFSRDAGSFRNLRGLHFHTNCDAEDFGLLGDTLQEVVTRIGPLLPQIGWINVGGGYFVTNTKRDRHFTETARHINEEFGVTIIFEPGAAFVDDCGSLVTTVLDVVSSEGKKIAIVDTSVNHLADVLDFNYRPRISGESEVGPYEVIVAGRSCLAGDLFGTYFFDHPIERGMRLTFIEVGAYSLSKATMFNGLNLPSIHLATESGDLLEIARYDYRDFRRLAGDR